MSQQREFYQSQRHTHKTEAQRLRKLLLSLSSARLVVFLAMGLGIYFFFGKWQVAVTIGILGTAIFLYLLSRYTDAKQKRELSQRLATINEEELQILDGNFHNRLSGQTFEDPSHFYSLDIDLFGKGSFFQYTNRTATEAGKQTFIDALLANRIDDIEERQEAIKELSEHQVWSQNYTAIAQGVKVEYPAGQILNWLKNYQPFLHSWVKWVGPLFSVMSVLCIVLGSAQLIPVAYIGYWLLAGLGITAIYLKKINKLASNTDKVKETIRQYALLLEQIESISFSSELLKTQQTTIENEGLKASEIFSKFSKALDALDNRNNLLSAVLGNGYFLWDIWQSYRVERWIVSYRDKVEDWFDVIPFFDAYNTLGTFAYNHPDFVFPEISDAGQTIDAKDLGHPLLNKAQRVDSDLSMDNDAFFIVTGANMAGKSTFLRTVALHIVMANMGLPVCASSSKYNPVKLITSMRTTDSLTDDSSYFFSELTRLKYIVDHLKNDRYFVILDEILKGTNSTDKAIGSQKFVQKLVTLDATGIIATHDLSLTEIEAQLEPVKNYFFDARIETDELYFDYKLKKGVCENMNASFLLKKMEIV
ncbi:DNA mismatch repair protein MutS [Winogradskyella maritima]|uniref:DNA mismatch repair protein MutS n=1 Tax=Winogradskyella maritima TaxID=1517766 RepID=A0ABV8AE59_9FLAO|nr:DNA mismatch repair protein MutS [Winogradskyella maritima]